MAKQIKHLRLKVTIDRAKIDAAKRTAELSFSSETPVERWDGNEVLSHKDGEYDFSRINSGNHPLLLGHDEHDPASQIGVIESANVQDGKGRAVVRFGNSALAKEIFQDVQDGIRKNISVGYDRTGVVESNKAADGMVTTRYRWRPTHIAIVPVPADVKVGIGRDRSDLDNICPECSALLTEQDTETCPACGAELERAHSQVDSPKKVNVELIIPRMSEEEKKRMRILLDAGAGEGGGGAPVADPLKRHRATMKELRAIGKTTIDENPHTEKAIREYLAELDTRDGEVCLETERAKLYQTALGVKKPAEIRTMASEGYSEDDIKSYDLVRAILSCIKHDSRQPKDGIEREWHDGITKTFEGDITPKGFMVPFDVRFRSYENSVPILGTGEKKGTIVGYGRAQGRDMSVGNFGQGGALVPTVLDSKVIELLRNRLVCYKRGAMTMAGLTANMLLPRQTAPATFYSLPELGVTQVANQQIDQIPLTPHRLSYEGRFSLQLLKQAVAGVDIQGFMMSDASKVLAIKTDYLAMFGGGGADEPVGMVNQPGIGSITFGGAPTFASLVNMETALAILNADIGKMAYVTSASSRGILKQTAKTLTGATTVVQIALWDGQDAEGEGMINGYPAMASNQILNNIMIFANWEELIIAFFGGLDVLVDPYTQASSATYRILMHLFMDSALRHPASVCASTDPANI
jgi:HK97 family phage major capsid protein